METKELMENDLDILDYARMSVIDIIRNHPYLRWSEDDYWWFALQDVWSQPRLPDRENPVREDLLYWALVDLEVPRECIVRRGARTYVELDNISFVYRTKSLKGGGRPLEIAPHRKGCKFSRCVHGFIHPSGSAYELADRMLRLDRLAPGIRSAARQGVLDGLREQRIRQIKYAVAGAFLDGLFGGRLPDRLSAFEIADTEPGAMDLIRLKIDNAGFYWDGRWLDIPFDRREMFPPDYLADFIRETRSKHGELEVYKDDETGIEYPVLRLYPSD